MSQLDSKELELIRPLEWRDVFEIWRNNEADRPSWIEHYKSRGFDSWEEWRQSYVQPLRLAERHWNLYRVIAPEKIVPAFHGGPFRSWIEKFYAGKKAPTFAELAEHPEVRQHGGVLQIMENFPQDTTVSAVMTDDGIVIVEGMHRCCAIALAAAQGKKIAGIFLLALTDFMPGELPVVGRVKKQQ